MAEEKDFSNWFKPEFSYYKYKESTSWRDGPRLINAVNGDVVISHPLMSITVSSDYEHAKQQIAKQLAKEAASRYSSKSRGHSKVKPQLRKFYRKACYLLRLARFHGFEFTRRNDHPLYYYSRMPKGDIPDEVRNMYAKDHVYRGMIVKVTGGLNWQELHERTLAVQASNLKRLLKPIKRMLANKKISVAVAYALSKISKGEQQQLINHGQICFRSREALSSAQSILRIREHINRGGRTPAKDMKICGRTLKEKIGPEHELFVNQFLRAGGVVPTSVRGVKRLHRDMHNRNSAVYRFLLRGRNERSTWTLETALPELEDIGATIKILKTPKNLIQEGQDMKHCVGTYAGLKGLFLHVEREEDKATLFCSGEGRYNQVYGPGNTSNPLTIDLKNKHMPILEEWIKTAQFTEIKKIAAELPTYD